MAKGYYENLCWGRGGGRRVVGGGVAWNRFRARSKVVLGTDFKLRLRIKLWVEKIIELPQIELLFKQYRKQRSHEIQSSLNRIRIEPNVRLKHKPAHNFNCFLINNLHSIQTASASNFIFYSSCPKTPLTVSGTTRRNICLWSNIQFRQIMICLWRFLTFVCSLAISRQPTAALNLLWDWLIG